MIDKSLEILERTHDGDDLHPRDLKLVEWAVNDILNDAGRAAFEDLHRRVVAGEYTPPPFHGIEHLSIDHDGYVYWRGVQVEHYDRPWAWTDNAKAAAQGLAIICMSIERDGETVTQARVFDRYAEGRGWTS